MNLRLKITRTTEVTLLFLIIAMATAPSAKGLEWSSESQLTTNIASDMKPSIMQAIDDSIWVVWASDREAFQNDLYYKTSSDNGLNWSPATPLTSNSSFDGAPSATQTSNGTIWVVWASDRTGDYEIWYKTSSDNGLNWSNATRLTTNSSRDTAPSILQDSDGTIWAVWHRYVAGQSDLYYKTSSNNGQTWSNDTRLTTDSSWDMTPSITQTRNGTIWVAWSSYRTGDYEIWYKTSSDGGLNWSNATQLTETSGFDQVPSIVQAADDSIWIFWSSDRPGGVGATYDLYYKNSSNFGLTWSSDFPLTTHQTDDLSPSAVSAIDGSIWVVWSSWRTGYLEIWYKTSDSIPVHDVAITSVTPSTTAVNQSEIVFISVVAENQGTRRETFNITVYTNLIPLKTKGITLNPRASMNLTFLWDTSGVAEGAYTISAEADMVAGEEDFADNTYVDGTITVTTTGEIHDVATLNVTPSSTWVYKGNVINIYVEVKNEGTVSETFNVTAYYNSTPIQTQDAPNLEPNANLTLTFTWSTTGVSPGNYVISATAAPVQGETDLKDNTDIYGTVRIRKTGDVNGDDKVTVSDLVLVQINFGSATYPDGDINGDDKVTVSDLVLVQINFGR